MFWNIQTRKLFARCQKVLAFTQWLMLISRELTS